MARTLTPFRIRKIYKDCTWKRGDLDGLRKTVVGVGGEVYAFHERRLRQNRVHLETMLVRYMPDSLMRTKGCTGLPWYAMGCDKDNFRFGSGDVVKQLIALAVGAELVTMTARKLGCVEEVVEYVIIEDGRIRIRRRRENSEYALKYHYKKTQT